MMRVIAGSARGTRLQLVPGDTTRPITDRAKEALFSILQPELPGARVLDLFAGTGAVGIEALSRGAAHCLFNDREPRAIRTIQQNLESARLGDRARVSRRDAFSLLRGAPEEAYDLIYVAPPQYEGLWRKALEALDGAPRWGRPEGLVIAQIHPREDEPLALRRLEEIDRRRYAGVQLQFYAWRETEPDAPDASDTSDAEGESS